MPTVVERSNAEFAGRVIDSLLPRDEEIRRACLNALADSINMAHAHGEAMWGITLHGNIVRLNVGHVVPFDMRRDGIFVAVIKDALTGLTEPERATLDELVEWQGQFHSIKGSQSFRISPENLPLVWPLIQQPYAAFIERAAQGVTQLHRDSREAYSPGVPAFLRQALNREIPEPRYKAASVEVKVSESPIVPRELAQLMDMTARTRNVLLYGPPGTGKTYLVQRFATHFISPQLTPSIAAKRQHRLTLFQGLNWSEAIALTMLLADDKGTFMVPELVATEVLQDYVTLKKAVKPPNTIHLELMSHTSPDNPHVKIRDSRYRKPVLFDKNDRSEWSLTPEGTEHIEAKLSDVLLQLRSPQSETLNKDDYCDFVTFHQSFTYEEFVEGLKPIMADDQAGGIRYEVVPGVFRRICERAEAAWRAHGMKKDGAPKYLLVIDEINRANIAKVLGELITLIEDDKRLGEANELTVRLPMSGARFGVPPNLYILGTMNTADRSIALLDLALRRRFTFVEMRPQPEVIEPPVVAGVNLRALLTCLNERIAVLRDRDHQIGHSYLLHLMNADDLRFAWYRRIVPLLQEYFYNDGERLKAVIGGKFVQRVKMSAAAEKSLKVLDIDQPAYEVAELLRDEEFLDALRALADAAEEGEARDALSAAHVDSAAEESETAETP